MNDPSSPTALYEEFAVDPALQHWVAYGWRFRALQSGRHPIPPEVGFTLSVIPDLGLVSIRGPHDHAIDVEAPAGLEVIGLRIWPGTIAGVPASQAILPSRWVEREETAEAWLPDLTEAILSALDGRADGASGPDGTGDDVEPRLSSAMKTISFDSSRLDHDMLAAGFALMVRDDLPPVAELARCANLSDRQFRRRFRRATGLSPRSFRRARRIRLALEHAVQPSCAAWIDLAATHGYADQAHLCREFRRRTGHSPNGYLDSVRHIEHRLGGSSTATETSDPRV